MSDRKKDHIDLAFRSQLGSFESDKRFNYEPLLSAHPDLVDIGTDFIGKRMTTPIWVSSMTGGTKLAERINTNLARACNEFGMGMGLGSCRMLLDDDKYLHQFNIRSIIGDHLPFYANLGIAQIEKLILKGELNKVSELIEKLKVDGLIIHVNPLQEYLQPEGDKFNRPPIEVIKQATENLKTKIIVKEVGQGMGPQSLKALLSLGISGIEFGAYGGTNFAKVELLRSSNNKKEMLDPLAHIGHNANEMLEMLSKLNLTAHKQKTQLIISGGIKTFLDGYYLIRKSTFPAVYGQASAFLKYAQEDYSVLKEYIEYQVKGLKLAAAYLFIKS